MKKFHCFFEQSGTFKNEFRKMGYTAYDYDILNDFGETDYIIDLFLEIERAYDGKNTIFDDITSNDMILAFFPCIRFEDQIQMCFRGTAYQCKKMTDTEKLEYDLKLHDELSKLYNLITKMTIVCLRNNRQELLDHLKERIGLCNKYIKIHKEELAGVVNVSETNRHLMLIKNLTIKKEVYEEILSKIEKE